MLERPPLVPVPVPVPPMLARLAGSTGPVAPWPGLRLATPVEAPLAEALALAAILTLALALAARKARSSPRADDEEDVAARGLVPGPLPVELAVPVPVPEPGDVRGPHEEGPPVVEVPACVRCPIRRRSGDD